MNPPIYSHNITLRTVPASEGWHWIVRGGQLLMRNTLHIHMAFFFFLGSVFLLSTIPYIGPVAAALLMPALYLGVMATIAQAATASNHVSKSGGSAMAATDNRARASKQPTALLDALGSPFRKDASGRRSTFKRLANLGIVYAISVLVLQLLYSLVLSDNSMADWVKITTLPPDSPLRGQIAMNAMMGMLGFLVLYTPVAMAFWFTQQLVGWHGQSITKSMFFSWLGCWRNLGAFVVFGLAWVGIFLALSFVLVMVSTLLGATSMALWLMTPMSLILMVWVFCSFYASYESLVQSLAANDAVVNVPPNLN
jgi:hypothetical protein